MRTARPDEAPERLAEALLGRPVRAAVRLGGGANSRLYRVADAAGQRFVLKEYLRQPDDGRDRIGAEVRALALFAAHAVEGTPRLLAVDRQRGAVLMEWLDGEPVGVAGTAEADMALAFLGRLHALAPAEGAGLPEASEACLSLNELLRQLDRRIARLQARPTAGGAGVDAALDGCLADRLLPAFAAARRAAEHGYHVAGFDAAAPLAARRQTLSPSDFGFHNALRCRRGRLVFLDFEYFGRDDPAKLTADVLLHPGMRLTPEAARHFRAGAAALYGRDPGYRRRLALLLPLYAVRWALIVLNEFLPERWARRAWAGQAADREAVLARQLAKADAMLARAAPAAANDRKEGIAA